MCVSVCASVCVCVVEEYGEIWKVGESGVELLCLNDIFGSSRELKDYKH